MKPALLRWWLGVFVAFVAMCPHLRMFSSEWTRYFAFWGWADAAAIIGIVLAAGTLVFAAYELVRWLRWRWLTRVAGACFVLVTGLGAISNLDVARLGAVSNLWPAWCVGVTLGVAMLAAMSVVPRLAWIPRAGRGLCLVVSPVVVIVFGQMLMYSRYSVPVEDVPGGDGGDALLAADGRPGDVYLFVFDAWSYERTFVDGDVAERMPNLAALVSRATVYRNAHSPFAETRRSLPGIIFQTDDHYVCRDGVTGFLQADRSIEPAASRRSLVHDWKRHGYATHLIGWCHPYRRLFGPEAAGRSVLDYARTAPFHQGSADGNDLIAALGRHVRFGVAKSLLAIPKPLSAQWPLNRMLNLYDENASAVERANLIHGAAMDVIRSSGGPKFGIFHYPVPHGPYVFTRTGPDLELPRRMPLDYAQKGDSNFARPDVENHLARYRGNLEYTDTLLGEALSAMKAAGRFEAATIILTADHSWRVDPEFDGLCKQHGVALGKIAELDPPPLELTHVPLVIKLPYQRDGAWVDEPVKISDMRGLIGVERGGNDESVAVRSSRPHPAAASRAGEQ